MSALLLQVAIKASVVFTLAWIAALMMRRQSAAARHLVWTLGISAALLLPVLAAATPAWDISLPGNTVVITVPGPAAMPLTSGFEGAANGWPAPVPQAHAPTAPARGWNVAIPSLLIAFWLCGAVIGLIKLAVGFLRVRAIASGAEVVDAGEWRQEAADAASRFELRTRVALRKTTRTVVPLVCGVRRPTILLPFSADDWSAERRRVVLLHESAHVKRHDCATLALARLAVALHWFNPLAYVALKELRAEQERAADDLVLTAGTDASAYADHLLEIARAFRASDPTGATALAMARPSDIEGRLLAILEPSRSRQPLSRTVRAWAAVAVALPLMPLAALHVSAATAVDAMQVTPPHWSAMPHPFEVPAPPSVAEFSQAVPSPRPNPPAQVPAPPTPPAPPAAASRPDDATRKRIADALMGALDDGNQRVREQALDTLASMRDERAVPALVKALGDSAPEVRERAATALGNMRDSRAVAPLAQALRDGNASVRRRVAWALGAIADPMAIDALTGALKDADPRVREQAAQSLGWIARGRSSSAFSFSQSFDVNLELTKQDAMRALEEHRQDLEKLRDDLNSGRLLPPVPPVPALPPILPVP